MRTRLNAEGGDLPYPLQLHVLDHELINAFALPGGHVVLFRGLIEAAESPPDEVAAVLAHEIGHVAHRDPPTRGALRTAGGSIGGVLGGLLFGDFAGGTVVLMMAQSLINANYSQAAEARADVFAHAVLTRAEVNPAALGHMFERLRAEYGDSEGIVAHFASHPTHEERIQAALDAEAAAGITATPPVISDTDWQALRKICGEGGSVLGGFDPDSLVGGILGGGWRMKRPRRPRRIRQKRLQRVVRARLKKRFPPTAGCRMAMARKVARRNEQRGGDQAGLTFSQTPPPPGAGSTPSQGVDRGRGGSLRTDAVPIASTG